MKTKHISVLDHLIMSVPISLLFYGSDTDHLLEGDGTDPSLTAQAELFRRDSGRRGCLKGDAGDQESYPVLMLLSSVPHALRATVVPGGGCEPVPAEDFSGIYWK